MYTYEYYIGSNIYIYSEVFGGASEKTETKMIRKASHIRLQ